MVVLTATLSQPFRQPGEVEEEEGEDASAMSLENRAAKRIQNCWRSRVSKRIYRYYRQDGSQVSAWRGPVQ